MTKAEQRDAAQALKAGGGADRPGRVGRPGVVSGAPGRGDVGARYRCSGRVGVRDRWLTFQRPWKLPVSRSSFVEARQPGRRNQHPRLRSDAPSPRETKSGAPKASSMSAWVTPPGFAAGCAPIAVALLLVDEPRPSAEPQRARSNGACGAHCRRVGIGLRPSRGQAGVPGVPAPGGVRLVLPHPHRVARVGRRDRRARTLGKPRPRHIAVAYQPRAWHRVAAGLAARSCCHRRRRRP
jgi:hypothetical protein